MDRKINLDIIRYYIRVNSEGVILFAGVNNVPLVVDTTAEGISVTYPINEWLVNGDNFLTGSICLPDGVIAPPPNTRVNIKIFITDSEKPYPYPKTVVQEFMWPPAKLIFPIEIKQKFSVENVPDTILFRDADVIETLTAEDKNAILDKIEKMRDAIEQRDYSTAYDISKIRFNDQALSEGMPVNSNKQAIMECLQEFDKYPDLVSRPLMLDRAAFERVAFRKSVLVSQTNGRSGIVFESDSMKLRIDTYLAKIKGQWEIVR